MTKISKKELSERIERIKAVIRALDNEVYFLSLELKEMDV